MTRTATQVLKSLALLVLLTGAPLCLAQATLDRQLLVNPSAEEGVASPGGAATVAIPGWNTYGTAFTVDTYASEVNVPARESQKIGGGTQFFYGGSSNNFSYCRQFIDVSALAGVIDAGTAKTVFSAFITGYQQQSDNGVIELKYYNSADTIIGSTLKLGPQLGNFGEWVYYRATDNVPAGTRKLEVQMISTRLEGSDNDTSFDNLSVVLTQSLPSALGSVTPPSRQFRSENLVVNPGAQDGLASADGSAVVAIPGWTTTGNFTVINYGGPTAPTPAQASSVGGGTAVFSGGPGTAPSSATQVVDLSTYATNIDADKFDLDFYFAAGAQNNRDTTARVLIELLDASNQVLLTVEPGPVVGTNYAMAFYYGETPIPPGTRKARITLRAIAEQGGIPYNGAYFDTILLRLIDSVPIPLDGSFFVTPANLTYGVNLLVDPGAESATPVYDNYALSVPIPGWSTTGNFTAVHAYEPDFYIAAAMERIGGGQVFFSGGNASLSTASQTVDVAPFSQAIDEGRVSAHLEGQLGGFGIEGDNGRALVYFLDYTSTPLGPPIFIGPSSHGTPTGGDFQFYETDGTLPAGTRQVEVVLAAKKISGGWSDAYFDNLWLSLNAVGEPNVLLGDVDGSHVIDVADVILLLRHCLGLTNLNASHQARADMNHDGVATITDAPLILRRLVGLPWGG